MSSQVAISNLALSNIGKENISSLDEASAEARACKQFYDLARDVLLQSYPWRFAGKTVAMAQITNDKPGAWRYAYRRPVDCLKVRWVRREYSLDDQCPQTLQQEINNPYEIEGTTIYCNIEKAFLRYTFQLKDASKYPPLFVDALAGELSTRLAMPLTRDLGVRKDSLTLARSLADAAQVADANEVRESSDHESEFVAERS